MNGTNHVHRACEIVGGVARLAALLGVRPPTVSQWRRGPRPIPAERCPAIERATGGAVRCEDLRPDVDWAVLRRGSTVAAATDRVGGDAHAVGEMA